ncbi:MAG: C39 family peptidase [Candidatus Sungbacteria bacterium]|nr:C39 family peptidase [bacterium]MDZ4260166.1 C39 family peptidase [Candidatus Sungbacteria bacterium]
MLIVIVIVLITPSLSWAATLIAVPFTSQAPFGNWAQPWQDFCEEASVAMAVHFVWGVPLMPSFAETEMQIIRQYEQIVFKKYKDTSASETASILSHLFGFKNVRTQTITSRDEIKKELSAGNIIIIPAAGRMLKNPYFTPPGPLYHMLVIKGFDDERGTFITNDPGTRKGNGFAYSQSRLFDAIHDWNEGDVLSGAKKIIVIGK